MIKILLNIIYNNLLKIINLLKVLKPLIFLKIKIKMKKKKKLNINQIKMKIKIKMTKI